MASRSNRFLIKLGTFFLAILSRTYIPYLLLGLFARVTGGIASIHLTYPAVARHRNAYAFQTPILQPIYRVFDWVPSPIGIFQQGGATGLVVGVPAYEAMLIDPQNAQRLGKLCQRLARVQRLTGASEVTLAGILPSYIARSGIDTRGLVVTDPRPATTQALLSAIDQIIAQDFDGTRPPILLFGGAGYIGTDLARALDETGAPPRVLDVKAPGEPTEAVLKEHRGEPVLLLDVARRRALEPLIETLWPGVVLLNETYPEPTGAALAALAERGVLVRHVAGVEGRLRPHFPGGYTGAVPCCAAHRVTPDTRAVITAL